MRTMDEIIQGMSYEDFSIIGARDPVFWIRHVLPQKEYIIKPFHEEWINLFMKYNRLNIMAPTGFGKTQVFGVALPLWLSFYNRGFDTLIISHTSEQAKGILERIKNEISENELLRTLEPEEAEKESWTKTDIITRQKNKIFSKAYTPNVRSFHVNYVVADELGQYVDHSIFFRWVHTRVTAKSGKLVGITTPVSAVDLPHKLIENPEFITRIYPAIKKQSIIDDLKARSEKLSKQLERTIQIHPDCYDSIEEGSSIFPEVYSNERLQSILNTDPISFEREYMMNTQAIEGSLIEPNAVIYCFDDSLDFSYIVDFPTYVGVDFAVGKGKDSDYSVITVIENNGQKNFIKKIERMHGWSIKSQIKRLQEINDIYKPVSMYLDATNMGIGIVEELRSLQIPVVDCKFDHRSRNNYLLNLKRVIDEKRLVIPRKGSAAGMSNDLFFELTSFIPIKTKTDMVTYQSTASHDDMVMSLALALSGSREKSSIKMDKFFF